MIHRRKEREKPLSLTKQKWEGMGELKVGTSLNCKSFCVEQDETMDGQTIRGPPNQ